RGVYGRRVLRPPRPAPRPPSSPVRPRAEALRGPDRARRVPRRGSGALAEVADGAVPATQEPADDVDDLAGEDLLLDALERVELPPPHVVHELALDRGPARGGRLAGCLDAREEELLVLAHRAREEVEDRGPAEHRAHELVGGDDQTGLLPELA